MTQRIPQRSTEAESKPPRLLLRKWWPVTVLASVLVISAFLWTLYQRDGTDSASPPRSVTRIGPAQGQLVDDYLKEAAARLEGLGGAKSGYALMQLRAYTAPGDLAALLPAAGIKVVRAMMRAPLPQVQTEIITVETRGELAVLADDVGRAMDQQVSGKHADAADARRSAEGLRGSSQSESRLRTFYQQSATISGAEADAYAAHCACVYALVVRATPDALRRAATSVSIRVTDPAVGIDELAEAAFVPLLPEQTHYVQPLPDPSLEEFTDK